MLFAGEGGAGTWSDGKLTTKVGRNSDPVRRVLHTLYTFGAPQVPLCCRSTICHQVNHFLFAFVVNHFSFVSWPSLCPLPPLCPFK